MNIFLQESLKRIIHPLVKKKIKQIVKSPLNIEYHDALWQLYRRLNYDVEASACLRTANSIKELQGVEPVEDHTLIFNKLFSDDIGTLLKSSHNIYYRNKILANYLQNLHIVKEQGAISILDMGGGSGTFNLFMKNGKYVLAEPITNGLDGKILPFPNDFFDVSIACHVLEHIPPNDREQFIGQLLSFSKKDVVLINPCFIEGIYSEEADRFVYEMTKAKWMKEHIEHGLPKLSDLKEYAERQNLDIEITPYGSYTTTLSQVFLDYFGRKSLSFSERQRIHYFFNTKMFNFCDSDTCPAAYIIHLSK